MNTGAKDERDLGAFIPSFLDDYPLNPFEFRVYAHIARRAGSGQCWESIGAIAKHCYMNVRTTRAAVQQLAKHGLITYEERPGQTNLIKLTHHSHWTPATEVTPTKAGNPTPSKFDRASKNEPRSNLNEPTPVKFNGTPSANLTDHPYPNLDAPPLSNLDDKGTPYEGTPKKVLPLREGEETAKKQPLPLPPVQEQKPETAKPEPTPLSVNGSVQDLKNVPPIAPAQSGNEFELEDRQWLVHQAPWHATVTKWKDEMLEAVFRCDRAFWGLGSGARNDHKIEGHLRKHENNVRLYHGHPDIEKSCLDSRQALLDYWAAAQNLGSDDQPIAPPKDGDWTKHPKFNELVAAYKSQSPTDFIRPNGKQDELRMQFLQWAFNNIEVSA